MLVRGRYYNQTGALFWSDETRISPFFPSNRRALNPLYNALEWIDGFHGLTEDEHDAADAARRSALIDHAAVMRLKDRVLRRLFAQYPWTDSERSEFSTFCSEAGGAVAAHASFEASAETTTAEAGGPPVASGANRTRTGGPRQRRSLGGSG